MERDWTQFSGFLMRRSKKLKIWHRRWCVLNDQVLQIYENETQTKMTGQYVVSEACDVICLAPDGSSKPFPFQLRNVEKFGDTHGKREHIIFCAYDSQSLEEWMISFIQTARGDFAESENFESGDGDFSTTPDHGQTSSSSSSHPKTPRSGASTPTSTFPLACYLYKHSSFSWDKKYFILDEEGLLRCYDRSTETKVMRWAGKLDATCRVITFPTSGFAGRLFCFAVVFTRSQSNDKPITLRISANSASEMNRWVEMIRHVIDLAKDKEALCMNSSTPSASASTTDYKIRTPVAQPRSSSLLGGVGSLLSNLGEKLSFDLRGRSPSLAGAGVPAAEQSAAVAALLGDENDNDGDEKGKVTAVGSGKGTILPFGSKTDSTSFGFSSSSSFSTPPPKGSSSSSSSSGICSSEPSSSTSSSSDKAKNYYINDSTLWGKLYSSDLSNPKVKEEINQLYMKYFTTPLQGSKTGDILVTVYHNERYLPIKGYNCLHLLPKEHKLTDKNGVKFPDRYLRFTMPPRGYVWPDKLPGVEEPVGGGTGTGTGVSHTVWDGGDGGGGSDANASRAEMKMQKDIRKKDRNNWKKEDLSGGWRYAPSFDLLNEEPYLSENPHLYPAKLDMVRRRKFTRVARPVLQKHDGEGAGKEDDCDADDDYAVNYVATALYDDNGEAVVGDEAVNILLLSGDVGVGSPRDRGSSSELSRAAEEAAVTSNRGMASRYSFCIGEDDGADADEW